MSLIRKHAALLAILSVLLMAAAAPYLIPADPDSTVFRSGSLALLLLAASFFPVHEALQRASRRQLIGGLVLGFLFAVALSLGSELFFYDGLLRGLGSALRRLAVPIMAAPVLGGLCARALMVRAPFAKKRTLRLPLWGYAGIILLGWLPVLLAFWPGMLNYDFLGQYNQHLYHSYSVIHPVLYSVLSNGVIALGEALSGPTLGVLFLSLIQMGCFAFALAYSCLFAQKHGAPRWALVLLTALYALHPIFSVMALSMTKDTLFAAAVLVFALKSWEMIEDPAAFFSKVSSSVFYVLLGIVSALFRKNGVFALVLMAPAMLVVLRGCRKKAALLFVLIGVLSFGTDTLLIELVHAEKLSAYQMFSLPAQQLVRAAQHMPEEDRAELRSWYLDDAGMVVYPHLADPAKGYIDRDRIEQEGGQFMDLWKKHAGTYAHEYLEAFLMLNVGSWYPDDLSHSTIYPDVSYNDKGYLQLQEIDGEAVGIETCSFLPKVTNLFERICRRNYYQKYPIISVLFCTATPFWVLLLACCQLIVRKKSRYLPAALGVFGLWLSYLMGPCTLARYTLPLFCLSPVLLLCAFCLSEKEDRA